VQTTDSLRDALDALVLTGAPALAVRDEENRIVGSISMDAISAVLGAEVPPLAPVPEN
jgi:osmoprotectant transport system ATP-binding protein